MPRAAHPLQRLLDAWPVQAALSRDERHREAFVDYLKKADPKTIMRLAWDSGVERDMGKLLGLWSPDGSHSRRISEAYGNLGTVPQSVWTEFSVSMSGPCGRPSFAALSGKVSETRPLLHFTHDPAGIFESGFNGTTDISALCSTFQQAKNSKGYNFAFAADGFDAANFADDQFYGGDALLFQASHLHAVNLESMDEEIVFWGEDVSPDAMVHLTARRAGWCVLDRTGEEAFFSRSISECAAAALSGKLAGRPLFGKRQYSMHTPDGGVSASMSF